MANCLKRQERKDRAGEETYRKEKKITGRGEKEVDG
jgi:hypothetical protein